MKNVNSCKGACWWQGSQEIELCIKQSSLISAQNSEKQNIQTNTSGCDNMRLGERCRSQAQESRDV